MWWCVCVCLLICTNIHRCVNTYNCIKTPINISSKYCCRPFSSPFLFSEHTQYIIDIISDTYKIVLKCCCCCCWVFSFEKKKSTIQNPNKITLNSMFTVMNTKKLRLMFEFTDFHSVLFATLSIWDEFPGFLSLVLFCFSLFFGNVLITFLLFCLCYVYVYFSDRKKKKEENVDLQTINYWIFTYSTVQL